jgi:hypothetical protein
MRGFWMYAPQRGHREYRTKAAVWKFRGADCSKKGVECVIF